VRGEERMREERRLRGRSRPGSREEERK